MKQTVLLGYRRKSVVRDATDLVSPEQQTHAVEAWAKAQNSDTIIEWYEDIDRSAREEKGRPGWLNLMRQLERPEVSGVIAWSFDRLYRNVHQFLTFLNRLEQLNKRLIVVRESLDTSTPIGRAIVTILMVIAQLESDQTSERMKTGITYRREVQGRHWGPTPFGCDRDDQGQLIPSTRRYWLNPFTGEARNGQETPGEPWEERKYYEAIKLIYTLYATGDHSYDSVTTILNKNGWRFIDRHGQPRPFDRDDVRRSLAYWQLFRGDLPTGKIQQKNGKILAGGHQPILPIELCEQVAVVMTKREHFRRRPKKGQLYLLGNVLYCGVCQKKMVGAFEHGQRLYRHLGSKGNCPERWILADQIETEAIAILIRLNNTELMTDIRQEAERIAREAFAQDESGKAIIAELERQRERLKRLEDLYLDGDIDKDRYRQRKLEIGETIAKLENDLYTICQMTDFGAVLRRMESILTQLTETSGETKKALINSIIERLEIGSGKILHLEPRPWSRGFF